MRKFVLAAAAAFAMFGGENIATAPKAEAGVVVKIGYGGYYRPYYKPYYYKPYVVKKYYHKPRCGYVYHRYKRVWKCY